MDLPKLNGHGEAVFEALFVASSVFPGVFVDSAVLLSEWHVSEQRACQALMT